MPVDKSGRVYVVGSVPLLHVEAQTVQEMLDGWRNQQLCRNLDHDTIEGRIRIVERFLEHTNEFPWTWTPTMAEEFFSDLRSVHHRKQSTIRGYQNALRLFCSYVSHPDYGWDRVCEQRFGMHPAQVFFEWNTAAHVQDNEQTPAKRAFTKRELQDFFDHADDQVSLIAASGRKGWLPAYRDAVMFKVAYSYGLRRTETSKLDVVDCGRNPAAPEFGRFGMLHLRYGKAVRGQPPSRRNVPSVMGWAVEAVADYVDNVRPRFGCEEHPAMWLTERGGRVAPAEINARFVAYRDALRLPKALTPHSLRHSWVICTAFDRLRHVGSAA